MQRKILRLLPFLTGVLITLCPFYRVIFFSDRALLFRDLVRDFLPSKKIWRESILSGEGIPYWNHFIYGGTPYYSSNTTSPLNPFNIIFLFFKNDAIALNCFIVTQYLLLFLGFYLLARKLKLSPWSSAIMGSCIPTSGLLLSAHSLPHCLSSMVAVPFWALCMLKPKNAVTSWIVGACIGWPVIAGDPQFSYVMAFCTIVYGFHKLSLKNLARESYLHATIGLSSIFFSAIQLLPTIDMAISSSRLNLEKSEIMSLSLHPYRLIEAILPLYFGNRFGENSSYFGEELINFTYKNPFIFSIYPGMVVLLLAGSLRINERIRLRLTTLAVLVFLAAFGSFVIPSLYELLLLVLPGFSLFRYPERLVFWAIVPIWVLAVHSLRKENIYKFTYSWTYFLILASVIGWILLRLNFFFYSTDVNFGVLSVGLLSVVWLVMNRFFISKKEVWLLPFLFTCILTDILFTGQKLVWDQSIHSLDSRRYPLARQILDDLKSMPNDGSAKRMSSLLNDSQVYWPGKQDHVSATTNFSLDALLPNTGAIFGLEDSNGYSSLSENDRTSTLLSMARRSSGSLDTRFIDDLMAVRYVSERLSDGSSRLRINHSAQPYVFSPSKIWFANSKNHALNIIRDSQFRTARDLVILHAESSAPIENASSKKFRLEKRNGKEIEVFVTSENEERDSYITLNESFNKNWRATFGDVPVQIERANLWAMAMRIPSFTGTKVLRLTYFDPLIPIGQYLTLLWFIVLGGILVITRRNNGIEETKSRSH